MKYSNEEVNSSSRTNINEELLVFLTRLSLPHIIQTSISIKIKIIMIIIITKMVRDNHLRLQAIVPHNNNDDNSNDNNNDNIILIVTMIIMIILI